MFQLELAQDGRLRLSGRATLHEAADLHAALLERLPALRSPLTLDLEKLELLDSAGVQILVALKRHLGPGGLAVAPCPPAIAGSLALLGFDTQLEVHDHA